MSRHLKCLSTLTYRNCFFTACINVYDNFHLRRIIKKMFLDNDEPKNFYDSLFNGSLFSVIMSV